MAHALNLDQIEEVSEGTFNWELDTFLESKRTITSPLFRFGKSKSVLMIGCETLFLDSSFGTCRILFLSKIVPDGFSLFSKVTSYSICLIDSSGQEFQSANGTLIDNQKCIIPTVFLQADLAKIFRPGDTATISLSWYSRNKSSLHEEETQTTQELISEGTQITQDLISGEPRSTLLEKLSDDLKFLYSSKSDTDCVLKVDSVQFPAHRALLSARSAVFAAMFQHETSEKLSGVVDIRDVDVAVLGDVLTYMYSGKIVGLTSETAAPMYEFSDKYAIFELRDHCLCFLKNNITIENVCDAAVLAHTHGEVELEENVSQFIEDRLEDIQQSNAWKHFANANPSLALKCITSSFVASKKNKKEDLK